MEHYVENHPYSWEEIWDILSENPYAIHLLEQNLDKIDWFGLSENPGAIHLLEQNLLHSDKIDWFGLSKNSNALPILEKNLDKIKWTALQKQQEKETQKLQRELDMQQFQQRRREIEAHVPCYESKTDSVEDNTAW